METAPAPAVPTQPVETPAPAVPEVAVATPAPAPVEIPAAQPVETPVPEVPVAQSIPTEVPTPAVEDSSTPSVAAPSEVPTQTPEMVSLDSVVNEPKVTESNPFEEKKEELETFVETAEESTSKVIEIVKEPENELEKVTKTVIVQSLPLGKVQPVAPIAVIQKNAQGDVVNSTHDNIDDIIPNKPSVEKIKEEAKPIIVEEPEKKEEKQPAILEKLEKIENKKTTPKTKPKKEEKVEVKEEPIIVVEEKIDGPVILDDEPTGPVVLDEEPKTKTKKKKIDIDKIDDEALKVLEDTVKVEQDTFVVLTDDEIENKESTRKIIRGKDKFKKKEIITAQLEEKPFVVFCNSCGNIVSADDVICPHCEEPIK
jgi:hypothetical protein